jgi:hypothetical protein
MTWSPDEAAAQRKMALARLLDDTDQLFVRSERWYRQAGSGIPDAVWSLLDHNGLVRGNDLGGRSWRLTVKGWIEACRLLREEVDLDSRFGVLSAHLKSLGGRTGAGTTVQAVAEATGLHWRWVNDAIDGQMAERIFDQHGAAKFGRMGDIEIPAHIGIKM